MQTVVDSLHTFSCSFSSQEAWHVWWCIREHHTVPKGRRRLTEGYKIGYSLWHIFSKEPDDNPPCMQTLSETAQADAALNNRYMAS